MKTLQHAATLSQSQKIQIVKGEFTPTQALDIVLSLLSQKINHHRLQEIQLWENDHEFNLAPIKSRILELEKEKEIAEQFISQVKLNNKKLEIDGILNLKIIE